MPVARHGKPVPSPALLLAVAVALACACKAEQPDPVAATAAAEPAPILVDQALLADLLGEAVEVNQDRSAADGLLVRLAFEPLIRQTGPVELQLVQSTGYRLLGVAEGAPLWQLGLREGDVLTTVDGKPIVGREHELRSLWERRPSRAAIGYQRDGQARTLALHIRPGAAWPGAAWPSSDVLPSQPSPDLKDPFARSNTDVGPEPEPIEGMRCVAADTADSLGRCEIERATILRLRDDPAGIAKQARIVPAMRDGVTRGFKVYGIRRSSVASQLGLQNGDLIVAFGGQPLSSLESAMMAFTALSELGTFPLTVERNGVAKQLTIAIVDKLK